MTRLSPSDTHHLKAAEGWLGLGNHIEANAELDNVSPSLHGHPMVLDIRWKIFAKAGKWVECVDIAAAHVKACEEDPGGWINRSYALHELKRTKEAFELLQPAAGRFPGIETVPYNLACYSCQLDKMDDARSWLKKAFTTAEDKAAIKAMTLEDKDLAPLRAEIKEF